MVVIKTLIFILLFCSFFFINKSLYASYIVDYETEKFIDKLIFEIKEINSINKKIKYRILSDKNINAFVDKNNIIYITSGLIENSPDYTALLSVIAHEIGHIEKNHITLRKENMKTIEAFNSLGSLSIIAGSLISNNPELIQGLAINSASYKNLMINFSKDQEREADYYAINTLKKMNISLSSTAKLIKIIEENLKRKGFDSEMQKFGSHPLFQERLDIVNFEKDNNANKINTKLNNKFMFIQAKFLGYNENISNIKKLKNPYKLYAESILYAKNGELNKSLKNLNTLIATYNTNYNLIETKADILFSYGYIEEAILFYKKVFQIKPDNKYAQIRIFLNENLDKLSLQDSEKFFLNNLNLINKFFNNKNILFKYQKLSNKLQKKDWQNFLEFWINVNKKEKENIRINLENYSKKIDKDLQNLIKIIYNNYI